jgi:hypothetical protein
MTLGCDAALRRRILEELTRELSKFEAEYANAPASDVRLLREPRRTTRANVWSGRIGLRGRADAIYNGAEAEKKADRIVVDAKTRSPPPLKSRLSTPNRSAGRRTSPITCARPLRSNPARQGYYLNIPSRTGWRTVRLHHQPASRRRVLQRQLGGLADGACYH